MGKDDSVEPVTKKLKQSQLSFKSPRANCGKKSKTGSPLTEGAVCQSKKHVLTEIVDLTDSPRKVDKSLNSSAEKTETSIRNNCNDINDKDDLCKSDKENSLENPQDDLSKSSNDNDSSGKEDCTSMDVDSPVSESASAPLEQSTRSDEASSHQKKNQASLVMVSEKSAVIEIDSSDSCKETGETDIEMKSPRTKTVIQPHQTCNLAVSENQALSPSKHCLTLSSDSELESAPTSSSSTPVTPKTPSGQSERKMTPKMIKRHEESSKRKQLQQQLKEEKRAKLEKEKHKKLEMKLEEEKKKKEIKEERKKKRIAEMELKNEEKRLKKEDKKLKKEKEEEEKRKKKEQKEEELKKEEEKKEQEVKKKERAQAAFAAFFKKQPSGVSGSTLMAQMLSNGGADFPSLSCWSDTPAFMPFPLKSDMKLAELNRRRLSSTEKVCLDAVLSKDTEDSSIVNRTYLLDIKQSDYTPRVALPTWPAPVSEELHDCIIIEAQVEEENGTGKSSEEVSEESKHIKTTRRAKLLQFCENRRPAYFGTWTKRSKQVSGRTPFSKDGEGMLDYEVDSDSEWEEEEEGEDLDNMKDDETEGQEEETDGAGDAENGYLLDNTFVPHGYLSDEEQPDEEQIHESVEKQKDRLVALKEEFDEEMKQGGAQALKPKLLGCLWVSNSTTQVSRGSLYEVLLAHRAVWDENEHPTGIDMEPEPVVPVEKSPTQTPSSKQLPHLILQEIAYMVDGSRWPLSRLVREVAEVLSMARPQNPISRLALTRTIKNMASKTLDSKENSVWTVKQEIRSEYGLGALEDILTPTQPTPISKAKSKETLLDNFLRGNHNKSDVSVGAPPAKKRISLTPVLPTPPEVKTDVTPTNKKKPESIIGKKKVAFVTLPPRTPGTTPQKQSLPRTPVPWTSSGKQSGVKPHVDTPRPPINRFLNKTPDSTPETINNTDK